MSSPNRKVSSDALTLTVLAALLRLVPHPPNFAPIGGVSLLSGAKFSGWQSFLVPIVAMLVSDPILSYLAGYPAYSSGTPFIYLSFLISVLLGRIFLRGEAGILKVGAVASVASLQFFALTNFFVWLNSHGLYAHTPAGLASCYVAALPFLGRTLLGDLFYSGILFTLTAQLARQRERSVVATY